MKLIQPKSILWLYAIAPLGVLVALVDYLSNGSVKSILPNHPEDWWFWIYIFGMPHVFASFLLLADKDYLTEFKQKLINTAVLLLLLPYALTYLIGYQALFFFFTALIVYHTIAQQFGIALVIGKTRPDQLHKLTTLIGAMLGVIVYAFMYADKLTGDVINNYRDQFILFAYGLLVIIAGLSVRIYRISKTIEGRQMAIANVIMLVSIVGLFHYGLEILSIIIGRIIHEFTAWIIYSHHDHNRNQETMHNLVYQKLSFLPIPAYALGMVIALTTGIAFTYLSEANQHFLAMLIVSFSLYHYWIEGFIWKGKSGPKQHIGFSTNEKS